MATRNKKSGGSGRGFGTFLFGFLCALLLAGAGGWAYLHWAHKPLGGAMSGALSSPGRRPLPKRAPATSGEGAASHVAADPGPAVERPANQPAAQPSAVNPAAPEEGAATAHLDRPVPRPPFDVSEDVFEAGAHVYKQQCASCHGVPGQDAALARRMQPPASQLWRKAASGAATGVSDHAPGQTFWQVKDGVRHSGMPSYQHVLSDNQIWDVSLLLQNAGQPLPDPVSAILRHP